MASKPSSISGDLDVLGTLRAAGLIVPNNSITDAKVSSSSPIRPAALQQSRSITFAQVHGSVSATERRPVYVAGVAGTLQGFTVGSVVVCAGAATITVNLYKNGSSILTIVPVLDNANTVYVMESGTFSSAAFVAGDVFEIVLTATAGGGTLGQGVFANLILYENNG